MLQRALSIHKPPVPPAAWPCGGRCRPDGPPALPALTQRQQAAAAAAPSQPLPLLCQQELLPPGQPGEEEGDVTPEVMTVKIKKSNTR